MAQLPAEMIVFEILTRVPPKAVGRSKSVCKTWYALLSTDVFVREDCSRNAIPSNQKVLVVEDDSCSIHPISFQTHEYGQARTITIPFPHRSYQNIFNDVKVLSHLNGLLCVCHTLTSDLYLWNPLTTVFKRLPPPFPNEFYRGILDAVGLYTDAHDDFKVMYIRRRDRTLAVTVWSTRDESWRLIPLTVPEEILTTQWTWSSGTLCGGTLYFVVGSVMVGGDHFLIAFDVDSEQFRCVQLPPIHSYGLTSISLLDAQGTLVMFLATGYHEMQIDMWVFAENEWHLAHQFPLISLDTWSSITHYATNGKMYWVMAKYEKVLWVETLVMWYDKLHSVTHWTTSNGALFTETLVSP